MRKDIVVTTPKTQMEAAAREAQEAREVIDAGGECWYFRNLRTRPKHFLEGGRVFYVENGWVRGFAKCFALTEHPKGRRDETTGEKYGPGVYANMDAQSWRWIEPLPMRGFQGWRYWREPEERVAVIGNWRDPKPPVPG